MSVKGKYDSRWGYIDTTGKIVIPYQYDYALEFSEGLAAVCEKDKIGEQWVYINTEGKVVIRNERLEWSNVTSFHEGYAWVKDIGSTYPIDKSGEVIARLNISKETFRKKLPTLLFEKTAFGQKSKDDITQTKNVSATHI